MTSAELPSDEKDAISHRGQALRALVPHVVSLLALSLTGLDDAVSAPVQPC